MNTFPTIKHVTRAVRIALGQAADPIGVLKGIECDLLNLIESPCADWHEADVGVLHDMLHRVRLGLAADDAEFEAMHPAQGGK